MKRLLIVGTGGQGRVVLDCALAVYDAITFITNDLNAREISNYKILYEQKTALEYIKDNFDEVIVAIGNNDARSKLSLMYHSQGLKLATIIHPNAVVSPFAQIDEGTVILANAVINSFARIGKYCIINTGSIVEHDCILEDGVHISPNVAMGGAVHIGRKTWVCIGSSIANNIMIGENVIIGAGSVVLKDIPDNVMVAGVPAIPIKYRDNSYPE
jgi:sugar O-acyltransferase (sialic acid O-acetyltransferase NeuD family)